MPTYLQEHRPRITQFRARRAKPTGLIVLHTAESQPDEVGPDDGTMNVARFIRDRTNYGSYHSLADSDSRLRLVPFHLAAFGDGTGSNEFGIHISAATQAHRWPTLPQQWVDGCIKQMAQEAAAAARWLKRTQGITVPARRITKAQSDAGQPGFISHGQRDPDRRSDPGEAFPWTKFLAEFARLMRPKDGTPKGMHGDEITRVGAHLSMQFSDTEEQMAYDAEKVFRKGKKQDWDWITGTEAGAGNPLGPLLKEAASDHGFMFFLWGDVWVALRRERCTKGYRTGQVPVLKPSASRTGKHTARGLAWAGAYDEELGRRFSVSSAHWLTKGRPVAGRYGTNLDLNEQMARATAKWGLKHSKGYDVAFAHADFNIVDRTHDVFLGQAKGKRKMTTSWDELQRWENTGHGNIDAHASMDRDGAVRALSVDAFPDREIFFHSDHNLVLTEWGIRPRVKA